MNDPYLVLVERFVMVAKTGSIQGAAKNLNLSQPSLTHSIQRIEEIFECKLFERTKKGVLLTLTGQLLFQRSKYILDQSKLAREEISDIVGGRAGSLRIAAGTVWATRYLPPIIHSLQIEFPDLKFELDLNLTSVGLERLHKGEVDLVIGGVHGDTKPNQGFTRENLIPLRYALGCGKNSPLANAKNVSIESVTQQPLVLYHEDELLISSVIEDLENKHSVKFTPTMITRSFLVALEMIIDGPYVVFLAEAMFKRYQFAGVRTVRLKEPLHEFETAMFYRDSLRQTEPFTKLLSSLRTLKT